MIQFNDILWCNQQVKSINTQRKKIVCLNLLREKEKKKSYTIINHFPLNKSLHIYSVISTALAS